MKNENQTPEIRRTAWGCMVLNFLLAVIKFAGGIAGSSQAVVADAVHTLSDSVTDVVILLGVRHWSKPPDPSHPYGHRRIETLITILIGLVLLGVGLGIGGKALSSLHTIPESPPGWIAFWAAVLSIIVKEGMYRWSRTTGKRIQSSSLVANAWHHRTDALASIPVTLAVAGALVRPAWIMLDSIGALIVCVFIFKASWDICRPALRELIDTGASGRDVQTIKQLALSVEGVRHVHAVRTRYSGPGMCVDLHVLVDPLISVRAGHTISGKVEHLLKAQVPAIIDVVIHIEPHETR
jgi:cation diffusion facilitator family transporter